MSLNVSKRFWALLLVMAMLVAYVPNVEIHVHAASSGTLDIGNSDIGLSYTVDDSDYASWTLSDDVITGQAISNDEGACSTTKHYSITLTITNKGDTEALLKFSYAVTRHDGDTLTVDGTDVTEDGSFEKKLVAGGTVDVVLKSNSTSEATSIKLSKIQMLVNKTATTTFVKPSNGSYTVNGTSITEDKQISQSAQMNYSVEATPASGYVFLGWKVQETGKYLSTNASDSVAVENDCTVEAVFTKAGNNFKVGSVLLDDLTEAATYAKDSGLKVVMVARDCTVSGSHTIPAGVTLLVPFDEEGTLYTDTPGYYPENTAVTTVCYRKLTLAKDACITVEGSISVGGKNYTGSSGNACYTCGPYGQIELGQDSEIVLNDGANLYAWGYITGSGKVTANSGSKVYELFQISDWRGGTATASGLPTFKASEVFPITQYYVQNVEAEMTLHYGATEYCYMQITMSGSPNAVQATFIGDINAGGLFIMGTEGSWISKRYDAKTDRMYYCTGGMVALNSITLRVMSYEINSSDFALPITSNIDITITDGQCYVLANTALLPGSALTVAQGAQLCVNKQLFIYDLDEWSNTYIYSTSNLYRPVVYTPSGKGTRIMADAKLDVNGTLTVAGAVYTTVSGANICSSEGTGVFTYSVAAGTKTKTYQVTQAGTSVSKVEIAVTAAKLQNKDLTYVETAGSGANTTFYYSTINNKWSTCAHENAETTGKKDATCGESGYTGDVSCPDCGETLVTGTTIPATGNHRWKGATCTDPSKCGVCGAQKEGSTPTGHSYTVSYTWIGDQCTATGVCGGCGKTVEATVTATDKHVITPGTCKTKEVYTLTAVFNESWAPSNEKEFTGSLDPNKHENDPTYEDLGNGKHKVTYPCCNHSYEEAHTFVDGSCVCKAQSKVTITFVVDGTSTSVPVTYGTVPTYTGSTAKASDATYHYTFTDWDKTIVAATENATYTAQFKTEAHYDSDNDHYCNGCDYENVISDHVYNQKVETSDYLVSEATCTSAAKYCYSCVCGAKGTETFEYGTTTDHNYGEVTYTWDASHITCTATRKCTCGATQTAKTTAVMADWDGEHNCQTEGYIVFTAYFLGDDSWAGTHKSERVPNGKDYNNHVGTVGSEWKSNETYHWQEYDCCGTEANKTEHVYDQKIATSDYLKSVATCTDAAEYYYSCACGESEGNADHTFTSGDKDPNKHTGTVDQSTYHTDENCHWHTYTCCGAAGEKSDHVYGTTSYLWSPKNPVCDATHTCSCGHDELAHANVTWNTTPGTCSEREKTVYVGTFTQEWAKTQTKTEYGELDPSNHSDNEKVYIPNADGETHKVTCKACEGTIKESEAHSYTNGVCVCGAKLNGLDTDGKLYVDGTLAGGIHQNGDKIYVYENGVIKSDANGMYETEDGTKYWIENGEAQTNEGVVVETEDGGKLYYYFGKDGKAITGQKDYHIDEPIGDLPAANYNFNKDGTIEHDKDTTKTGIAEADCGGLYYFINGIKIGKGLFKQDGYYYYARTSTGQIICSRQYYVSLTNGLPIEKGYYNFDEQGRMILSGISEDENGDCYYYDENGTLVTGFAAVGDDYYYFNRNSGKMYTNITLWVNDVKDDEGNVILQGGYYKFGDDGKMITTGFMTVGDYTYYMENGIAAKGERYIDGHFYLFNSKNSRMYKNANAMWFNRLKDDKGNVILESGYYNIDSEGRAILNNGFMTVGDYTYYMENGVYAKGERYIDGYFYLFNRGNGKLYKGVEAMWFNEVKDDEGNVILKAGFYDIDGDGKAILN